jgi:endonuclease/exonuclease/phosphatase family metal-dependent hydrolase
MKHYLRIITINLCNEQPGRKTILLNKWIKILSKIKGDVIFMQEVRAFNLEKITHELGMKLLNINNLEGTCVIINPYKLNIIDNNHVNLKSEKTKIYIGNIHLDDIPSISHHLCDVPYKSSVNVPLKYSLDQLLKLSAKRRLPRIKQEMENSNSSTRAIIAGDFNEPSHLDIGIPVTISQEIKKHGFVDTYRQYNASDHGYTWPAGTLYQKEPSQRVDMIYTKNLKVVSSQTYDERNKWISDHKMVITDLIL